MARAVHLMEQQGILETTMMNPYGFPWLRAEAKSIVSRKKSPGRKLWFRPIPSQDFRAAEDALWIDHPDNLDKDWDESSISRLPADDVLRAKLIPWRYESENQLVARAEAECGQVGEELSACLLNWIAFGTQGGGEQADSGQGDKVNPRGGTRSTQKVTLPQLKADVHPQLT
ncbi:hypothetical protein [Rhodococcus artemisiae]|uniref:Uncharacterized protein n=1 Tax=Rhodococcus artemisiae TaxID=714159 RepID=A0ABU7LJS8_9NOCA|nr:hypothetical protein [Rhodococcus artemisiae]MEE2061800.1 hypothetical protein [Rhodococcus artemisiae]